MKKPPRPRDVNGLHLGQYQPPQIACGRSLADTGPDLGPLGGHLRRDAEHDCGGDCGGEWVRSADGGADHGADGGAKGAAGAGDHAQELVAVVDAHDAAAVTDDVGGARDEGDAAVPPGHVADEAGALREGELGGGVDAALSDGGGAAEHGEHLGGVALDDGVAARGEESLDGRAADGGGASSGREWSAEARTHRVDTEGRTAHPTGSRDDGPPSVIVRLERLEVVIQSVRGHGSHVDDERTTQTGEVSGLVGVVCHDRARTHGEGDVCGDVLDDEVGHVVRQRGGRGDAANDVGDASAQDLAKEAAGGVGGVRCGDKGADDGDAVE
ncbi:hypothetical protein ACCO45_001632 [Purpureocillium lilacinum]|uniref:Uncharacterized protein n=1 Tax=Purpureocillium lilacinum TaxID=33203 RepID=A0ACC4EAS4_PURLI